MRYGSAWLVMLLSPLALMGQAEPTVLMTPRSSVAFSLDYAPTSGHLFLGENDQRKLAEVVVGYRRKLTGNAYAQWSWMVEAQPLIVMLEPVEQTEVQFSNGGDGLSASSRVQHCTAGSTTLSFPEPTGPPVIATVTTKCGRITDYGAGLSPLGQHIRFLPFSRVGPFVEANAGFVFFNRNIPSDLGRRFNFEFSGGAGLEFALPHRRMVAAEYRVNHISNAYTAPDNSGIDQQMFRVSYIFGR